MLAFFLPKNWQKLALAQFLNNDKQQINFNKQNIQLCH
jgi:hypothetical protein